MLSNEFGPYKICGGLGVAMSRLFNQFNERNIRVTVIFPTNKKLLITNKSILPFLVEDINQKSSIKEIAQYFDCVSREAICQAKKIEGFEESIIIVHDNEMALTVPLLKKENGNIKIIFWLHSLYNYPQKRFFSKNNQKLFSKKSLLASAVDLSDLLVTSSGLINEATNFIWPNELRDLQLEIIKKNNTNQIIVVESLGCLPKKETLNEILITPENKRDFFLFPSRPSLSKGIGFFGELTEKFSQKFDFLAVGPIDKKITKVYPKIIEIGWLEQEKLFSLMKSAKSVLLPSITEGYGLSAAESILFSAKTIYHSIGGQSCLNGFVNATPIILNNKQKKCLYLFWCELLKNQENPIKTWLMFKDKFDDILELWSSSIINPVTKKSNQSPTEKSWASIIKSEIEKRMW